MSKISIGKLLGSYENRVFIGGDYKQYALITEMKDTVSNLGFRPIVANDYEMKEEEIHDCTMRLLHNCKHAIFDISTVSGALMEIERIRDYNTKALIVFSTKEEGIPKQQTTRMIDPVIPQRAYRNFAELRRIIENFLVVEDSLINYLIVSGAMEVATDSKPDTQNEDFKKRLTLLNSGMVHRDPLVCSIFYRHRTIIPPWVPPGEFVKRIYGVVLGRAPSKPEIESKVFLLRRRFRTPAQLFIDMIYSEENLQKIAGAYKFAEFQRRERLKQWLIKVKSKK